MRYLRFVVPLLLSALSIGLVLQNHIWNLTPVPRIAGEAIYQFQKSSEQAAFASALIAAQAQEELPVPVFGVVASQVADTYGEPRGTDRTHEGVDIFAPRGTYIRSATEGIVIRIGENRLGGTIVFVLGPSGERYYYAHLDSIDPALHMGQQVSTTTILGRVGTTGNATGTPPHLHFGIYGNGGTKDPFPRLR